ncbi:MAG: RnfABCDGE type electron transport complex subunit D [Treponema sp.]|nr:RnfABCDGE type electron transport complex subunit D [Treponema sp.]
MKAATAPVKNIAKEVYLSSSPHYTRGDTTQRIMGTVLLAMLPECVWGVLTFGYKALLVLLVSVASCVLAEWLFQKATKQKNTIGNLSAAVTGVLLALVLSSEVPLWMIVIGAVVAIVVAKGMFGGIGSNVFNPALTGRGFMLISFGAAMGAWKDAAPLDAISSATVLSQIKEGSFASDSSTLLQYFLGNRAGCIGEVSILLLILSFAFLLVTGIIDWRAPVAMLATFAVATFIAALAAAGDAAAACSEVLLGLCTGGVVFGAVFMVTDYATTPVTKNGRLVFGFGCGLIIFLIRRFGGYPEGVMFSILIMNSVAPFLNKLTARKYGYGKKVQMQGGAK